jgi:glutamate racemase
MVASFAREIAAFLVDSGVEAIVVACNTASAAALPQLNDELEVPVWGVIEPGVEAAIRSTRTGSVGVIATKGAIASRAYQNRLEAGGLRVWAKACPLFVHLVEERLADSEEAEVLARHYLENRPPIDTLVLGCTHYPLLREVIQRVAGQEVTLVDSASVMAEWVGHEIPDAPGSGRVIHYATGDVSAYRHTAEAFGELEGDVRHLDLEIVETTAGTL